MKKYSLIFALYILIVGCKSKDKIIPNEILPSNIFLQGISGETVQLSWQIFGAPFCGFECFPDPNSYTILAPDFYEIFLGTDIKSLKSYKKASSLTLNWKETLTANQAYYFKVKAVYQSQGKEIESSVIMVSTNKIPQRSPINISNTIYTFDNQGDIFTSIYFRSPKLGQNTKAVFIGKNSKDEMGAWFYDFTTNKKLWLWKSPSTNARWSADESKVIINRHIDDKSPKQDYFILDVATLKMTQLLDYGKSIYGAVFSPDAKYIAMTLWDGTDYSLLNLEYGTGKTIPLLSTNNDFKAYVAGTANFNHLSIAMWGIQQEKIILLKNIGYSQNGASKFNLESYSINPFGGTPVREPDFEEPDWAEYSFQRSPDGKKIIFHSFRNNYYALWVKDLTTKKIYQITSDVDCSACNTSFQEWKNNNEIIYSTSNGNTNQSFYYSVKLN